MEDIVYTWIGDSARKFKTYSYAGDSNYELGFKGRSGMVYRVINKSVDEWLDTEYNVNHGKVCIVSCYDSCSKIDSNSSGIKCMYSEGAGSSTYGGADLLLCSMPSLSEIDLQSDSNRMDVTMRMLMAFHVASYNRASTVVIDNIGTDTDKEFEWFSDMIKQTSQMYSNYLCNVYYLVSDSDKYQLCARKGDI